MPVEDFLYVCMSGKSWYVAQAGLELFLGPPPALGFQI